MDRRKTGIIALTAAGVLAGTAAVAMTVPTTGTMVPTEETIQLITAAEPTNLHGTNYNLTEQYIAFHLDEAGALVSTGDTAAFDQSILDGITAQLQSAPAYSIVIVDADSVKADGLTTVLTTVTPTNGMVIAGTNEEMQQWLTGLFPEVEGTLTSLDVPNVPNAAFTYTQTIDELPWTITEYVFQYGDATVTARLSTADATGETRTEVDTLLAGANRG